MANQDISFRPIRPDDQQLLSRIYASTREDELAVVDWTPMQKTAFLQMQFEAQHKFYMENFTSAEYSIVQEGKTPIGRLYVDRRQDEIRLIDIALLPEYRNRGIGGRLLRDLLAEGQAADKPVRIHVERDNPALRLYRRLGFKDIDEHGVYFLMEWKPSN